MLANTLKRRAALGRLTMLHGAVTPVLILFVISLVSVLGVFAVPDTIWFSTAVRWPPLQPPPHDVVIVDLPADAPHATATLTARLHALGARTTLIAAETAEMGETGCMPEIIGGQALRYRDFTSAACGRVAADGAAGTQRSALLSPDFSMATSSSIPRMDITHLEDTAFAREVVRGKTVLLASPQRQPVYVTPMYRKDGLLSSAVFEALMIESMLRKRSLRWASAPVEFAFSAIFLGMLLWWRHRKPGVSPILGPIAVALLALVSSALLLRLGCIVVPIGSTLATLTGVALLWAAEARHGLAKRLHTLEFVLQHATHSADRGGWRSGFDADQPMWAQLNALAIEHFGAKRSAMLSLPPGKIEVEVADLYAERDGVIVETQRDHRLAPYDIALAQGRPTVAAALFFPAPGVEEGRTETIMTALSHAGETLGFWVLEVDAEMLASTPALLDDIAVYADAFARSLYRAGHVFEQRRHALPGAPVLESLGHEAAEQIAAYRNLHSALRHPIAVLDPYGRMQFSNTAFGLLARTSKQPLLSMPLLQMLIALCGLSRSQAQAAIRGMIVGQLGLEYPVALSQLPIPLTLHAYPVPRNAARAGGAREPGLQLDLIGVVLELLPEDGNAVFLARFDEGCERMVAATGRALDDAVSLLRQKIDTHSPATNEALAGYLFTAQTSLAQFEQQLRAQRALDSHEHRHCDLRTTLDLAIHGAHESLSERRILCRVGGLETMRIAADPDMARALLDDALALLIHDAAPDSHLICEVSHGHAAMLRLRNDGFGVPDWHLHEAIAHAGTATGDDPLRKLLAHTATLSGCHGRLLVTSSLGEGYEILIEFPAAV